MTDTSPQIDWISYGFLHRYPHMGTDDANVWERYITSYPQAFDAVAYDIAVGEGATFDTTVNQDTGGSVGRIYQRRIDVVGRKGGVHTIIEVKVRASTTAIRQVSDYQKLAVRDYPELAGAGLLIIAESVVPDFDFLAKEENVPIVIV